MSIQSSARSVEQIEADLAATRAQMGRTIDALAAQLSPAYQVEQLTQKVSEKAQSFQEKIRERCDCVRESVCETVDAARAGDEEALKKVGIAIAGTVVVVALIGLRISHRR
ncbi:MULTISPECIES: DUF3618 domain-containing protein [unclassified Schaalia]|uniref:DUF3618 domain-containing protein n=1 Tax=unclassified Schaalia TaxID=2691889 RepID=UPI001E4D9D8F|nr:DUF3618 domain-containing protein [Schaalia sp. lx-260]MCD4557504.1 DUF3618 domain-containing protein [Schaalia sp. lx-100]